MRSRHIGQLLSGFLGDLFGKKRPARSKAPKGRPPRRAQGHEIVSIGARTADGRHLQIRLQSSAVQAYLDARRIPKESFDARSYLLDVLTRHQPLRPSEVQVSGDGYSSITDFRTKDGGSHTLDTLEIPSDVRQRLFRVA